MSGFIYISRQGETNKLFGDLLNSKEIYMDTEATGLDPFTSTWLLLQIKVNDKIYILDTRKLEKEFLIYLISTIKTKKIKCVFHNAKFDLKVIKANTDIYLENNYDTMLGEVLINQGIGRQFYSYESLVEKYFKVQLDKSERDSFIDYTGDITNQQLIYSALDVKYLDGIKNFQVEILTKQKQDRVLELESKLITPVTSMEYNGTRIDEVQWRKNIKESEEKVIEQKNKILDIILKEIDFSSYSNLLEIVDALKIPEKRKGARGILESITDLDSGKSWIKENFNINSHTQIKNALNLLGIEVESTGEEILTPLKDKYPICNEILEYRGAIKNVSTYGENVLEEIHPKTKRLHVDVNQLGTHTGRFAIPRLHQIPAKIEYRKSFIGRDGYKILTVDYSQLEYKLVGAFTGDRRIIESYLAGKDMHTATASLLYKVSLDDVTKDQRSRAKNINFATLYWSTVGGLKYKFSISETEAQEIIDTLTEGYPQFMAVREYVGEMVIKTKKAVTPLGRIRFFEDKTFFKDNYDYYKYIRSLQKEGWNHTIQGWGSDIIKLAMNDIYYQNPFREDDLFLYNQVHDEVDVEVNGMKGEDIKEFVVECMLRNEQNQLGETPAGVEARLEDHWVK